MVLVQERQAEVSIHKDVLLTQSQAMEKAVSELNVKVFRDSLAREMYEEVAARVKFQASGLASKSLESRKHTMMLMGELLAHFRALEGVISESVGYAMEVTSAEIAALSGDMQLENQEAVRFSLGLSVGWVWTVLILAMPRRRLSKRLHSWRRT
jgi:NAD/NADP transhydrogenase beta subunit